MPTAACAIRTRTDAIQLASTLEGDCEQELTRLDQRDGGLMTAGAPAKSHQIYPECGSSASRRLTLRECTPT